MNADYRYLYPAQCEWAVRLEFCQCHCLCLSGCKTEYKTLVLALKALEGMAPPYIQSLIEPYNPRRALRSANTGMLTTAGQRSTRPRPGVGNFNNVKGHYIFTFTPEGHYANISELENRIVFRYFFNWNLEK